MEPRHLYTIRWSQPYATRAMRPYMRHLREEFEKAVEARLELKEFSEANIIIERIRHASKS